MVLFSWPRDSRHRLRVCAPTRTVAVLLLARHGDQKPTVFGSPLVVPGRARHLVHPTWGARHDRWKDSSCDEFVRELSSRDARAERLGTPGVDDDTTPLLVSHRPPHLLLCGDLRAAVMSLSTTTSLDADNLVSQPLQGHGGARSPPEEVAPVDKVHGGDGLEFAALSLAEGVGFARCQH